MSKNLTPVAYWTPVKQDYYIIFSINLSKTVDLIIYLKEKKSLKGRISNPFYNIQVSQ